MANYYVIRIKFHWAFSYVTHYMNHSLLGTRRVISSIITRNFFVTRNKQPITIGTNRMCISRDDNCANTTCFPRQLPITGRNSLRRFAFFDVCDTSCPIGKLPFSFLLCDEFSQYATAFEVCVNPAEWKVSKGASKLKIKVLGADRISLLQFCDRLTFFEDAIHQIAKLTSDTVEVKCLTQADIESILFTSPPICITYNRRSKVVENVSQ